jgi:DNA-binding XRE family transcriptional regulator
MKKHSLDAVIDTVVGKKGTAVRDQFEYDLQVELLGVAIRNARKKRELTQEELGKLIGVQKAQISRLENNVGNVSIDTLMRVFAALQAKVKIQIELPSV